MRIYNIGIVEVLKEDETENGPKTVIEDIMAENTDEKHQTTDFGSTVNPKQIKSKENHNYTHNSIMGEKQM